MPTPELPERPVVAWKETRNRWWAWPMALTPFGGGGRDRQVTVSKHGLTITDKRSGPTFDRHVPWAEIRGVDAATEPDLARIRLLGGETIVLDRWHLPASPARRSTARQQRVDLLQRALAASRAASADPGPIDPAAR